MDNQKKIRKFHNQTEEVKQDQEISEPIRGRKNGSVAVQVNLLGTIHVPTNDGQRFNEDWWYVGAVPMYLAVGRFNY